MKVKNENYLDSYLDSCKKLNKSDLTIKNYHADLKKFINWYEVKYNSPLHQASGETITNYQVFLTNGGSVTRSPSVKEKALFFVLKMIQFFSKKKKQGVLQVKTIKQRPLAVNSRKRHLSTVKNFYAYLKETNEDQKKIFLINPVKPKIHGIKLKESDITHTKMLSREDWIKLKENAWKTRDKLILSILYYGGLRLRELISLKYEDFNPHKKTVTFIRKGGYRHELYIQNFDEIFNHLEYHKALIEEDGYLFSGRNGGPISDRAMYQTIINYFKKAGIVKGHGPHSFRKACATNLYRKTKDLLIVRDYLNHNDAKVTQTYIDKDLLKRDLFTSF